jgi:uroporphyrinogen-III decarboxylase
MSSVNEMHTIGTQSRSSRLSSRERLLAVLSGREPDRLPVWTLYPRARYGAYVDVYNLPAYRELVPIIWQQTDFFDRRGIPAPFLYTAAARVESETTTEGRSEVTRTQVETPYGALTAESRLNPNASAHWDTECLFKRIEDLEAALAIPYEPAIPDLTEFLEAGRRLGDAGLMMMDLSTPVGILDGAAAPADFACWIAQEMDALLRFLDVVFEREYRWLEEALRRGAGPVFFATGTEFVAPPLASPTAFARLSTRYSTPLFELIHRYGGYVIVHHHGRARLVIDQILASGADAIHPIEEPPIGDTPLADAKRRMAGRATIVGSVQYDDLSRLEDEPFEALVRRQIRDASAGGGHILAPTAGPYETEITPQHVRNLKRMIELAHEWGTYPLRGDL